MSLDTEFMKKVQDLISEYGPSLDKQNDQPSTAPRAGLPTAERRFLEASDRWALREELRKKSTPELMAMFSLQARKKDMGIPFDVWASTGGAPTYAAISTDPILTRALDSSGAAALIRQDLEPVLIELFIRLFPYWDRISKEPSNGLVHAYDRVTSYGDAEFMGELGTVTDDTSAYERMTTPISVIATRRGVTLRSQFAVQAGGMGWSPEQLELNNGLRAIAHKMQKTIFQGNATVSGGTSADENGAYDALSFDGFRKTFNTVRAVDADPTAGTPDDIREKVNDACITAMQNAGNIGIALLDPIAKGQIDVQQDKNIRYTGSWTNVAVGVQTNAINTVFGPLPLYVVPGDSIGEYIYSGNTVSDMYLLDESTISVPYLGSDGPTVLDIPIGISGQLSHLYIIFGMWGLAVKAVQFSNKVRIQRA